MKQKMEASLLVLIPEEVVKQGEESLTGFQGME